MTLALRSLLQALTRIVWILLALSVSVPSGMLKIIRVEANKRGLDPLLVAAVIHRESRYSPKACYRGSHGLMQIQLRPRSCEKSMESAVAAGLYDQRKNIRRGVKLLSWWRNWWRKHHSGDGYHWLLHYNQGFGRCPKNNRRCDAKDRLPIRSGKIGGYADRVLEYYEKLKKKHKVCALPARQITRGGHQGYSSSSNSIHPLSLKVVLRTLTFSPFL